MSARPLRVLLVAAATSTTGGGERHVADLVRLLPERGVEVALAAPAGGDLAALAARHAVPYHVAEIGGGFSLAGRAQLRSAIVVTAPDIVHAHGSRAAFYARLADPRAAQRVVYTLHGIHIDKAGSALRQRTLLAVERALKPHTAHFVTVCESDKRTGTRLGVLDAARVSVVYNGIEPPGEAPPKGALRAELGIGPDVPLALSIGRFSPPKDHATLLRAWAIVRERVPDAVLALIGSGPLERSVRSLAADLGLGSALRLLEPRRDVASAYVDADVFCLSSLWEGLPYVVLEAMAFGVPVVATAVDGVPEAVADGESGRLVAPAHPEALAAALVEVLGDPAARERMGAAGERVVRERFTSARMGDELVEVYRRVTRRG